MHPRQLYLTQSGIKTTLKWYEVSLYFADCMHCCSQLYKLTNVSFLGKSMQKCQNSHCMFLL